jgi:hypothetical protein
LTKKSETDAEFVLPIARDQAGKNISVKVAMIIVQGEVLEKEWAWLNSKVTK